MNPISKILCKHEWKIIVDETTKSVFEHAIEATNGLTNISTLPGQLCWGERKKIQILACAKCGKIKRFVTDI